MRSRLFLSAIPFLLAAYPSWSATVSDNTQAESCALSDLQLPDNFVVYGVSGHSGRQLDYQIDQSGPVATQVDVVVSDDKQPVALILSAYGATIWNINYVQGVRIVAAVIDGYDRQIVTGLPMGTPVLSAVHADDASPCKEFSSIQKDNIRALEPLATQVFAKSLTANYPIKQDGQVVVGPRKYNKSSMTKHEVAPREYFDPKAPLAGEFGLQDALSKGIIRRATQAEVDEWSAIVRRYRESDSSDIPEHQKQSFLERTYVVVEPFAVPAGLLGEWGSRFIVPKGVPLPTGDLGHSVILDTSTGECTGRTCSVFDK